jgi:hypothetical protein
VARIKVGVPVEPMMSRSSMPVASQPAPRKKNFAAAGLLIAAAFIAFLVFSLVQDRNNLKQQVTKLSSGPTTQSDGQKLNADVAKLIEVPQGVVPVVKTPSAADIEQLAKENDLYKNARAGDAFLLYAQADSSLFLVIYRPSTNKVILAAPASVGQASQTTAPPTNR